MKHAPFSMLSPARLASASGMDPSAEQPTIELSRKDGEVNRLDVEGLGFDPVFAFNCLVEGLFLDNPPWRLERLEDVGEVSERYQQVADTLKGSTDVDGYYRFAQAACFLKKYEDMPFELKNKAESATLERWLANEQLNDLKNAEIWDVVAKPLTTRHVELRQLMEEVRKEIHSLIGEFPPDFSEVAGLAKFGPGVTLSHKIDSIDPILKCVNPTALEGQEPEVNWLLNFSLMGEVIFVSRTQSRFERNFTCDRAEKIRIAAEGVDWVDYERYATVPKSVDKRRSIGVGASLATWIQQAYDGFLRKLLLSWGIDLSNQDPNRALAYRGSLPGVDRPCTIDLTDASSRICLGLVVNLVSKPWARTLIRQRAKYCLLPDGTRHRLAMFSAMGNALTFSLQSLIFSAVVRVVLRTQAGRSRQWRVYGDDIIVPHQCYDAVTHALELLGFQPNFSKSFKEGYFRESCGEDYLHGTLVRPFYLKTPVVDVSEAYKVINLVQLFATKAPIPVWTYRKLFQYLLSIVPVEFRLFGEPSEVLDGYIWAPSIGQMPKKIIGKAVATAEPPGNWMYYRSLLTSGSCESHVRVGKRSSGTHDALGFFPKCTVTHSRSGVSIPGYKWRWFRVLSVNRKRLLPLSSKLIPLFIK